VLVEHGAGRRNRRHHQHQAGNLHEDDIGRRRSGVGVKNYRVIVVFENNDGLNHFLDSGWSGSAQTDAAAKAGDKGGAFSGADEIGPGANV